MFCENCGKKILDDSKFCEYCGGKTTSLNENQEIASAKNSINNNNKFSEQEIYQIALLISEAKHAANRLIIGGIGWIIGGIILTAITGGFFIFWGMPVYGIYQLIKGLYYRMMPHKLIKDAFDNSNINTETKQKGSPDDNKKKSNLHWE